MDWSSYSLHKSLFYRRFSNKTILYFTAVRRVYTYNEVSADIFDYFSCKPDEDLYDYLLSKYKVTDDESFRNGIDSFINTLVGEGILIQNGNYKENPDKLEEQIIREYGADRKLFSVTFELTYRCNERCRHCYLSDDGGAELTTEEIKKVLDDLSDMGVFHLLFTGGEVFIRKDLFEILEHAYSRNFVVDIFTNGMLIDAETAIRLREYWPRCVHFSVYSHIPEKHDAITTIKGSFNKTIQAIKNCAAVGLQVNIKSPLFEETKDDVPGLYQLASELNSTIGVTSQIFPKKNGDRAPLAMQIKERSKLFEIASLVNDNSGYSSEQIKNVDKNTVICNAGLSSICINPYGQVFLCAQFPLNVGDIRKGDICDIWNNSEKLNWWRSVNSVINKKDCVGCEHFYDCKFCPGQAYSLKNDPLKKYEGACISTELFYMNK